MNQIQKLAYLYQRYKDETCTPAERQAFMALVRKPDLAATLKELISRDAAAIDEGQVPITKVLSRERAEELFQLIVATPSVVSGPSASSSTASASTPQDPTPSAPSASSDAPVYAFTLQARKRRWWPAAAAAVLLLLAGAGYIFFDGHAPAPVAQKPLVKPPQHDALPGGNKAMLTLSNGSVIVLDSAADGLLAEQGNAKISKLKNGQLAYEDGGAGGKAGAGGAGTRGGSGEAGGASGTAGAGGAVGAGGVGTGGTAGTVAGTGKAAQAGAIDGKAVAILYNTLTTPRGGQYQLELPDGTKVWLNAASSITYPTSFAGGERRITMTGEAYFEVAKMLAPSLAGQHAKGEAGGSRDAKGEAG
ncbi:MAG TPA: FecR family protein, partial [Puia sp.]|nr:FecR family protein [Puia sp.]